MCFTLISRIHRILRAVQFVDKMVLRFFHLERVKSEVLRLACGGVGVHSVVGAALCEGLECTSFLPTFFKKSRAG